MITETAPAKLNLYLHVGPIRPDGLHELASLFVFTEKGDVVSISASDEVSLSLTGPFASAIADLTSQDNLVYRAAQMLRDKVGVKAGAAITLEKNLPVAAGIGGGSADAAAALRGLQRFWGVEVDEQELHKLAFSLGADIPACLTKAPLNVEGAGEKLSPGPLLSPFWVCLVNPAVEMPTGPVFRGFDASNPTPNQPVLYNADAKSIAGVKRLFAETRNDLQPAAENLAPVISETIEFLNSAPGAIAARMSGSGATCFAVFDMQSDAEKTSAIAADRGWWALASALVIG